MRVKSKQRTLAFKIFFNDQTVYTRFRNIMNIIKCIKPIDKTFYHLSYKGIALQRREVELELLILF